MSEINPRRFKPHTNNQSQPPPVLFSNLSDAEKQALLDCNGYLYGVRIDGNDGPKRSTLQAAQYKMPEQHHSSAWIKEQDDLISETIETQKSRNLNYVHYGWSIEASSTLTLEAECRIAQDHEANHSGQWTTKRTIVRRLLLDISPEELLCSPNFEKDVREAVGKPSLVDKYKALDRVFRVW
ncbi:hypothetical protein RhiLY_10197 [Ceratobasidium sp. AG-Ba]|nr:hypothetical protein RhiLY_10197 [Ceratobasidium sp. AG-Ba]